MRFVTKTIHAYLDYPVAILLLTAPFVLQLGASHPLAKWLSGGTPVSVICCGPMARSICALTFGARR